MLETLLTIISISFVVSLIGWCISIQTAERHLKTIQQTKDLLDDAVAKQSILSNECDAHVKKIQQLQDLLDAPINELDAKLLSPQIGDIALCSRGQLGIISSAVPRELIYSDGNKGIAWIGYKLRVRKDSPWSSREPRVVARKNAEGKYEPM
jgi:hypothetical protein